MINSPQLSRSFATMEGEIVDVNVGPSCETAIFHA